MGNHWTRVDFDIRSFLRFFLSSSILVSHYSSWDRCLIDCTINLILWDKLPCILPPMSNKGWTAIYHWLWPITPPFTMVPAEGPVGALQFACDCWGAGRPLSPGPSPSLPSQGWHGPGLVERLFDRPALAPRAGHLCYKMPPGLWIGTQLSQPGRAKLPWIALLCYLVSPMATTAISSIPKAFNRYCCVYFSRAGHFILFYISSHNQQ